MKNETVYNIFNLWRRDESERFTRRLAWFCACRSGSRAEELCNFLQARDYASICAYNIDYDYNDDPRELAYARQCLALFTKSADLKIAGVDRDRNFLESFINTERQCLDTNIRLSCLFQSEELFFCENSLVYDVSRKITEILQDVPSMVDLALRYGPGLNVGLPSAENTSSRHKLDAQVTLTDDIRQELLEELAACLPHLDLKNLKYVVGKLSKVPKNWKTFRSIVLEAILNGLGQLGIGSELKLRLYEGSNRMIDLTDQSRNRSLALLGSLTGKVATIDVENASNTLALMTVFHLVQSEDWFNLLDQLRTRRVEYNGQVINLEMFSSMGNGFTFELESIIFYAIAYVTVLKVGGDTSLISVFGDDIIVPSDPEVVSLLYHNLAFFGFKVNSEKSFISGPFRESCGADYFLGTNIRPFYLKDRWTDARLIGMLNYDHAHLGLFDDLRLELETFLFRKSDFRINFGPAGFGDGHIHWDSADPMSYVYLRRTKSAKELTNSQIGKLIKEPLTYFGTHQVPRNLSKSHDKPPYYFETIIKVPKKESSELELGDKLYPLYSIYRAPQLEPDRYKSRAYHAKFPKLVDKLRDFALTHVNHDEPFEGASRISLRTPHDHKQRFAPKGFSSHKDPYVVRGGWKTKVVRVYLHKP